MTTKNFLNMVVLIVVNAIKLTFVIAGIEYIESIIIHTSIIPIGYIFGFSLVVSFIEFCWNWCKNKKG